MNILVYGTIIGPGGIAHHTREFTKRLAKIHNVKFINFNIPLNLDGKYSPDMYKLSGELDDIYHTILHQQSLWDEFGTLTNYPLSGYDRNFKPDVHLVMAEANHYYHYQPFHQIDEPTIAYFPWETDEIRSDFFNELMKFNQVWVPSDWQRDNLIQQGYSSEKIKVVSEGVDPSIYLPTPKPKADKFTFLHIGTWEYRKSTYEIVKSFIDEYGDNPSVELKLSINNKFRTQSDEIDTFNKFGLPITNNIKFLGTMSDAEYINEIKNADAYLSCARGEGWNLPLIQSMAAGIPSIWSKVGGQLQFANGAELGCDFTHKIPVSTIQYVNGTKWYWEWGQGFPGNLYEPDFSKFREYIVDVYKNYDFYKSKAIEFSEKIRRDFDWEVSVNLADKLINDLVIKPQPKYKYETSTTTDVYYLIHAISFGDVLASTPTLRYLSQSHQSPINVVTHNRGVFDNNPYIKNILTFDEYNKLNVPSNSIKYESFTSAGRQDGRGIEKKFGHIDIRQLHAMDLGFQLPPENLHYDYQPNSMELDIQLPTDYVVLHVTNNWANRTWDYRKWYDLIQWLSDRKIFTVLIGFGHKELVHQSISDVPLEKQCPSFTNVYGLDLTNQGTMGDMWHVINGAKCIVTMDTGPLHLTGTTDTHIIQLGSAVHPAYRAPYRNGSQNYKYNYVGGECNLFCNSNLKYNVKEWGHINAVPPQNGCSENYSEFKCHPHVSDVTNLLESIVDVNNGIMDSTILSDVRWDGDVIRYSFSGRIPKSADVVIRDTSTNFKMYSVHHNKVNNIDESYWIGLDTDKRSACDIDAELYVGGELVETVGIKRNGRYNYQIGNHLINSSLFDNINNNENAFNTFFEVYVDNEYNKHEVFVSDGDIVLDIGANYGLFSTYALGMGASKVFSVEPIPTCYSSITKLSTIFNEIQPLNFAVCDTNDGVSFAVDESTMLSHINRDEIIQIDTKFQNANNTIISVNSIHINDLLEKCGRIDFLKVDCEGSEEIIFDVIDETKLIQIPKIIIEAHSGKIRDKIKIKLERLGYDVITYRYEISIMYCKLNTL